MKLNIKSIIGNLLIIFSGLVSGQSLWAQVTCPEGSLYIASSNACVPYAACSPAMINVDGYGLQPDGFCHLCSSLRAPVGQEYTANNGQCVLSQIPVPPPVEPPTPNPNPVPTCPDGSVPVNGQCPGGPGGNPNGCTDNQMFNERTNTCMDRLCPQDLQIRFANNAVVDGQGAEIPGVVQLQDGNFQIPGNIILRRDGRLLGRVNTTTNQRVICRFEESDPRVCRVWADTAMDEACQAVGCSEIVSLTQARIAAGYANQQIPTTPNAVNMMERGHVSWHITEDAWAASPDAATRELAGESFFAMHATMITNAQQRLVDMGQACMPGVSRLPESMSVMQSYAEGAFGGNPDNFRDATDQYERLVNGVRNVRDNQGRLVRTERVTPLHSVVSRGEWGAQVQRSFHNNLHVALNDQRDNFLLSSTSSTRKGLFWIIHGLVDSMVNVWLSSNGNNWVDWRCDYLRMDGSRGGPNCQQTSPAGFNAFSSTASERFSTMPGHSSDPKTMMSMPRTVAPVMFEANKLFLD